LIAAHEVFAAQGLRGTTMGDIARQAGVSRQAVYEQFSDKSAVFEQVVLNLSDQLFDLIRSTVADTDGPMDFVADSRNAYRSLFDFYQRHPGAHRILVEANDAENPAIHRVRERVSDLLVTINQERWAAVGVDLGRLANVIVAIYIAMAEALANLDLPGQSLEDETFVDFLTEFTLGGLGRIFRKRPDLVEKLR
jgi:AcrR family transcriptional regulator